MSEKKVNSRIFSQNAYILANPSSNNTKKVNNRIFNRDTGTRSIPGIAYFGGKLATGALGIVEGTTDLIAGGLADLFGNEEYADYVFQYDNWVQDLNQKLDEAYNPGKVGRFVGDVASGLGQSATFLIPGAGQVLFFTGVTGNAVSSASQTTGKTGFREYAYGAMSGTLEAILERYIAGTGQTLETITKSGAKNIASKVVKSYGKAAAKTTTKKMVAAQLISSAVGEGLEEFAGNIGDVGLRRLTGVDKEASINWGDAFYETIVGMASGTLMGGVSTSVQTAYEAKNGAQINSDAKRRDTMLTQARGLVKMAKEQSLDKGSDAVAARLSEIEASLTAYDNAKDKSGGAANIALGKINQALIGAELNIITDRHAEYIASLSDTEREQLAEYANAYFKDAGVEVTAKDLKDINNQITRALATLDWAGKIVNTMIGTDRILNEEVLAKMEAQQVSEEERAAYQNEQNAKAELERVKTEASENAKPITEGATWNGEAASYHGYLNGAETTLHIEKRNDGAYQAFFITEDGVRPVKLTEEQVKAALAKMTDTENRAEENKSSEGEREVTKEEKQPETKENEGESGTKLSLSEEQTSPRKKITRNMSEQERYELLKDRIIPLTAKANMQKLEQVETDLKKSIDETLNAKYGEKKALLKKIGDEFGIFKKYTNTDIELDFNFSRGNLKESVSKQTRNYINFAKMLTCFDSVIENAVGVEVHNRNESGYKVNEDLQDVYVLISAFEDGTTVYPVKLEIKEFKNQENTLYVAITLDGIKKEEVVTAQSVTSDVTTDTARSSFKEEIVTQGDTVNGVTQDAPSSIISIAQLFKKINPSEENFLKYVPKQFLADNDTNENSSKTSLGADSIPENETAKAKKLSEEYTETTFKATPEEVKAATKAVKQFKLLDAETREAIINMMRSAGGIDKVTVQSIAVFMSVRSGLQVRFMKDHRAEGSYDVLTKSGRRLILLDPSKMNGKHWRADIFFHELYHDMATTGDLKGLTKAIYDTAAPSFQHAVADLYTAYYNNGVSISKFLDGKKWTEKNVEAYFKEHNGVSFDDVMEEVAAGTMGRVMGSKKFIRSLRQVGILKRVYYNIAELVQSIANRSITVGGDNTAGFTLTFRDALGYKALYSRAVIESEADLSPEAIAELRRVIEEAAERDEDRARTKMSLSTTELIDKYAKLDLNQDISKLDGVPAIRLTDGSILPFTEPHVTFIQNNNIDVEDIASGGWISDGVYEASERSDTMRYKERMLAKKRMDEKRAARGTKMSLAMDEKGNSFVKVEIESIDALYRQKGDSLPAKVRSFLKQYRKTVLPIGSTDKTYMRKEGENEYTNPAKHISNEIFSAKMEAASEFTNILKASKFIEHKEDDGRHPDAVRGWNYYKTTFVLPDENGNYQNGHVYTGEISIKLIEKGDCFYDLTKIEDITNGTAGQALLQAAGSDSNVFDNSIPQAPSVVKTYDENSSPSDNSMQSTSATTDADGNALSAEQQDFFKNSAIRVIKDGAIPKISPDGKLFPVYHGTRTGEFYEFDKKLIGSSNDAGWFGRGFYFAFTEGEAEYYGKHVLKCYLNIKNPFVFDQEMGSFEGITSGDVNFDFASFVLNMAEKFPDLANKLTVDVAEWSDGDTSEVEEKTFVEVAEEIKQIYKSNRLVFVKVRDGDSSHYEYRMNNNLDNMDISDELKSIIRENNIDSAYWAEYMQKDGTITRDQYDAILDAMEQYGESDFSTVYFFNRFESKERAEKYRLSTVVNYLKDKKYSYFETHLPEYYMRQIANDFSEELKRRGYDGILQSLYGDEIVAFEPEQIKLTTNKAPTSNPDTRYSLSFDSTGNQLTEEQDSYFKDSKVRDAQSRLQVMYQGAAEEFYTFDKKKSKPSNLYGRGFYFTNSADQARHYGTVRPYYLNITNPLATQEKIISRLQMRKFLKAVSENEDYSIENYGTYDIEKILQIVYEGKSDFAMIYDVSLTAIGDLVEATELFNEINGTAYDGFILDTEAVTFKSEQAKLTANITPTSNPDTRYSLSLDSTPEVTVEDVQAEVNRVKWGFEWTDAKLLDNLNAVRRYLSKKYPDNAISLEIDNDQKRVIVDGISRAVDFDAMPYDADFADFLRSIGVEEADIASHLTAFTPSQRQKAGKKLREGEEKAKKAKAQRPRAYYKNQVTTVTNAILSQVIAPMAGGEAKLLGKDKTKLVNWLWRKMNTAKNQAERRKIANIVAEAFIARTIYADYEVNQNYEEMVVSGVIEDYENVRGYVRKIRADSVASDVIARYGEKKGRAVLNRWTAKDGISIGDAIAELQDQGLMTDVSKKNEAELLIALNEEYERLKGLSELRREFVPLALADKATLDDIQRTVREMILDFFEVGGKETEYARLARRYQELLAEKDAKQQKEIEALEARLNEAFTKRIDRAQAEADRRMAKAKERFDRRLTEANYGREYAKRMNRISADVRSLKDYVNRDYTAADSMEDRQTKGIAKAFLKATTRTGVKPQAAREAARVLLSWAETAMKDNENFIGTDPLHSAMTQEELDEIRLLAASGQRQTLTDEELKDFGISREKYEAAMEAQKAKESLSLEELEEFHTALKVAIRNYRNYDRFWNGERWVDLNEKARDAVSVVQTANENFGKKGFLHRLGRGIRKIAMPFLDPLSVAAAIDGYNYSGVFQELLTKLAYAEAEKNKMIIELRKPFEEFLKEHPKYQKRLSEAIIELEDGFKITVGQAISLTELNKRDQAKTALAISRIAFRMDDGSVKKLDGFDKLPKITTPNGPTMSLIEAQELVRGLQITPDTAISSLKAKGYTERTLAEFEKAVAKAEADAMPLIAQFGEERQRLIAKVEKQLTDDDRAFIKVVSDFFQTTSKEEKTKADLRNLGYTNVIDGYYFPIKRRAADIAKDISDGTPFTDFITTVNLSFNQSIVPNAKASIDVSNVWDVVTEHINGLAMWEHLYLPIQNINKIYNKNINAGTGTTNVLSVKSLLDERTEAKYGAWLKDLLLDVQGARQRETKTFLDKGINTIRGTYAVYQLGFNPQTVVKQTLSWAAAAQYLSPASIAKGITTPRLNAKELDRVSAVAAERMGEATVVKALSNTEKISKIGEKTMWGISKMDRFVNEGLFSMCQHEVAAKDPKKPIGSEDNLVEAGKLVSEVILKVQDSSDISTKSQAARSSNELIKAFTMFQSAGLKMFSRIFENVGFVMNYKHMSAEDQAKFGGQYKKAQKQLARSVGSAAAVAVLTALIVQMFKFLYDKDREDKDGNEITVAEDLATDAATELVGFVPVVGDVVDYFVNGYEMSNFFEDTANDTLKAFSQTFALMGKVASGEVIEDWEVGSMLRKVSRAAGSLTGIPVRNVENVLSGLTRRFFPEAGYTYDTLFYRANYTEDINKALKEGDTELAGHILELMIKRGKTGGNSYSDETIEALVDLHNAGYDVFPKSPDYEKLDRKGLEQFETVYQEADAAVEKLVKSEAFKAMAQYGTDESSPQASAIKTLYSGFFDLAEHDVLNEELSRSAAYFTVTDEHDLVLVKAYDKAIKLKTVELKGSRKEMLKAYMKELGMDKTAQAYAAYSCGYRTDDITSVIYSDLKGREDEKELLIALGLIESDEDKKEDETA